MSWWATLATLASAAPEAVAAPRCADRVQALKKLQAATQPAEPKGFANLDFQMAATLPVVTGTDKATTIEPNGGFRLVAERGPLGGNAWTLRELNRRFGIMLCVDPDPAAVLPPAKHRADADGEVLKGVLAKLQGKPAEQWSQAVLESLAQVGTIRCGSVKRTATAMMHVADSDRVPLIAKSMAENLTECACPDGIAESVYAHVALLADLTPAVVRQCAHAPPPSTPKPELVELGPSTRAEDLVQRLARAQGKPVKFQPAK